MTQNVYDFTQGSKDSKALLGGEGANLAELNTLGLPVPPGVAITPTACRELLQLGSKPDDRRVQVTMALSWSPSRGPVARLEVGGAAAGDLIDVSS